MVNMYVRNMLAGLARWQYEKLLTCAEVASELGPRLIIRWVLLLTMNGRSSSSIASRSNGEVVCAQYAGRSSQVACEKLLTYAKVASELGPRLIIRCCSHERS
jgi:hypothetical protein